MATSQSTKLPAPKESAVAEAMTFKKAGPPLCVCSYEDRLEAMDSLILMGESLCRVEPDISLHLTVPDAPATVRAWAARRPQVVLSTDRPDRVTGWDVKPWILLQQLNAGKPQALWLDTDMIVTRPLAPMFNGFPSDSLILSEEWIRAEPLPVSHYWGLRSVRPISVINACVVRATQSHRRLLEQWIKLLHHPRYREAQRQPFESRPRYLLHDGWLLIALLESEQFAELPFHCLRTGRHIAQCAGSSGYRPHDRLLDLFRGLPPLIHGLGRKPWGPGQQKRGMQEYLFDLATDVSPYVLAARKAARDLDAKPQWLNARTAPGALLRALTFGHPGIAGLPLAVPHAFFMRIGQMARSGSAR